MAWTADVVHHYRTAKLAGVVDDDVAEAHQSLRNTGGDGHVLNFAQRNVFRRASDEAGVDLERCIRGGVANHVSPQVVIAGNQQQRQRERD